LSGFADYLKALCATQAFTPFFNRTLTQPPSSPMISTEVPFGILVSATLDLVSCDRAAVYRFFPVEEEPASFGTGAPPPKAD